MVQKGTGRLFRRKDNKYLVYVPKDLAEDSMFPFQLGETSSIKVSISFTKDKIILEKP